MTCRAVAARRGCWDACDWRDRRVASRHGHPHADALHALRLQREGRSAPPARKPAARRPAAAAPGRRPRPGGPGQLRPRAVPEGLLARHRPPDRRHRPPGRHQRPRARSRPPPRRHRAGPARPGLRGRRHRVVGAAWPAGRRRCTRSWPARSAGSGWSSRWPWSPSGSGCSVIPRTPRTAAASASGWPPCCSRPPAWCTSRAGCPTRPTTRRRCARPAGSSASWCPRRWSPRSPPGSPSRCSCCCSCSACWWSARRRSTRSRPGPARCATGSCDARPLTTMPRTSTRRAPSARAPAARPAPAPPGRVRRATAWTTRATTRVRSCPFAADEPADRGRRRTGRAAAAGPHARCRVGASSCCSPATSPTCCRTARSCARGRRTGPGPRPTTPSSSH